VYVYVLIAFILFVLYRVTLRCRDGTISTRRAAFWVLFWVGVGVLGSVPSYTDIVARTVGIGAGTNLFFFAAIVLLAYLVFVAFTQVQRLEREVTLLTRALALRDLTDTPTPPNRDDRDDPNSRPGPPAS